MASFVRYAEIVALANDHDSDPRKDNAPRLSVDSTREQLIDWLAWNDRNGSYSDEDSASEGMEPLTLATAWELVVSAVNP